MRGLAAAISSRLTTPCGGLEDRVDEDRPRRARPSPRAGRAGGRRSGCPRRPRPWAPSSTSSWSPISLTSCGQVVEHPGALQRVDPGPERGLAEVGLLRGLDQALRGRPPCGRPGSRPRGCRAGCRSCSAMSAGLGDHLLVREVEEVDHPRGLDGDLAQRLGGADRLRLEEVSGVSQAAPRVVSKFGAAKSNERAGLPPAAGLNCLLSRVPSATPRRTGSCPAAPCRP